MPPELTVTHCTESTPITSGSFRPKTKELEITVIKAGFGNAGGNRYYSSTLLQRHAKMFEGSRMYVDHLTPEQERKLNGMPRSVRDLVATLKESWYDPATDSVKGKVQVCRDWFWELVTNDPTAVEVSIDALGTSRNGVAPNGRRARLVESFHKARSVDFVTLAGAGGKIDAILEAHQQEVDLMALDSISLADLDKHCPDLVKQIEARAVEAHQESGNDGNGGTLDSSQIAEAIQEAVSTAVAEATGKINADADKRVALVENRAIVREMLESSKLPEPSAQLIYESFHDSCVLEADGDKDGVTRLKEAVTAAIQAKKDEVRAWLPKAGVSGMGPTAAMLEAGDEGGNATPIATPLHDSFITQMGVELPKAGE